MFKKAAYYIMVFILLLSVIGITVNKHYSGNKLFSVSVFLEADSCCNGPCDCCNETSETFNLTDSFVKTDFNFKQKISVEPVSFFIKLFNNISFTNKSFILSGGFRFLKPVVLNSVAFLQSFRL